MAKMILLLVVQWVLLSVAIEGFLGGRQEQLLPMALASGACFAGACWLIRYDKAIRQRPPPAGRR